MNEDSWPDLLWQSDDGLLFAWLLTGPRPVSQTGGSYLTPFSVPANWKVTALADFDGNGSSDVLFREVSSGQLFVWWMNQMVQTGGQFLTPSIVPTNWVVAATEDFNGDGKSDIVWQDSSTGAIYLWYMNGATQTSGTFVTPGQVPAAWHIVGSADFNNDSHPDLVFRHTDGWIYTWFMNGPVQIGGSYVTNDPAAPEPVNPDYQIVALADFDHDGHTDIVFRSASIQSLAIAFFEGVTLKDAGFIFSTSIAPANWKVVGGR